MDTNYQGAFGEYLWRLHSQNSGLIADSNYEALNTNYNLKVKKNVICFVHRLSLTRGEVGPA